MKEDRADIIEMTVQCPPDPGDYVLEISMVQEAVSWFEQHQPGLPARKAVVVA